MSCPPSSLSGGLLARSLLAGLLGTFAAGSVAFNRSPSGPVRARLHALCAGWRAPLGWLVFAGVLLATLPGRFPRL